MNTNRPRGVSIVILNWNSWQDTLECLDSLKTVTYPEFEIIIVDNDSQNDSVDRIREYFGEFEKNEIIPVRNPSQHETVMKYSIIRITGAKNPDAQLSSEIPVFLIKNSINSGFTGGNNIGIRYAMSTSNPDFILLLNNDTIVDHGFLDELIKATISKPFSGFFGPKIYFFDYNGKKDVLNFAGGELDLFRGIAKHRGIGQIDTGQYSVIEDCSWIQGACMLIRTKIFTDVGYFDESYFLFWEEIDLCVRGKKKGWNSTFVPPSKIWHKIGKSTGDSAQPVSLYYGTRNKIIFVWKNASDMQILIFLLYYLGMAVYFRCLKLLSKPNPLPLIRVFLKGNFAGVKYILFEEDIRL